MQPYRYELNWRDRDIVTRAMAAIGSDTGWWTCFQCFTRIRFKNGHSYCAPIEADETHEHDIQIDTHQDSHFKKARHPYCYVATFTLAGNGVTGENEDTMEVEEEQDVHEDTLCVVDSEQLRKECCHCGDKLERLYYSDVVDEWIWRDTRRVCNLVMHTECAEMYMADEMRLMDTFDG